MFDPVSTSLDAIAHRVSYATLAAFAAGVATSVGPCTAPRLLAAAGVATGSPATRWSLTGALAAGLISAYALFGVAASALSAAFDYSRDIFLGLAALLAACGLRTLLWDRRDDCCVPQTERRASLGATFLLGSSFAFVVSPCCTPVVAAIVAYAGGSGGAAFGAACLAAFALGHALPLFVLAALGAAGSSWLVRLRVSEAMPVVSASMMIALAAYYGLLA